LAIALSQLAFADPYDSGVSFETDFGHAFLEALAALFVLLLTGRTVDGEVGVGIVTVLAQVAAVAIAVEVLVDALGGKGNFGLPGGVIVRRRYGIVVGWGTGVVLLDALVEGGINVTFRELPGLGSCHAVFPGSGILLLAGILDVAPGNIFLLVAVARRTLGTAA